VQRGNQRVFNHPRRSLWVALAHGVPNTDPPKIKGLYEVHRLSAEDSNRSQHNSHWIERFALKSSTPPQSSGLFFTTSSR
jgi:hypothetical protein